MIPIIRSYKGSSKNRTDGKISPIKLYTKVKKSIEKNTNIRYNLIDQN